MESKREHFERLWKALNLRYTEEAMLRTTTVPVNSSHIDALGLASVPRAYNLSLVQPLISQHIFVAPVQAHRKCVRFQASLLHFFPIHSWLWNNQLFSKAHRHPSLGDGFTTFFEPFVESLRSYRSNREEALSQHTASSVAAGSSG